MSISVSTLNKEKLSKDQELMLWRDFVDEDNPTLVIRRLLNTNQKEEEEWRQAKKFHMRVRVKDRSVNVIIDNSSAINFVAQGVIEKLNLPTEKLSTPFQVTWSNGHVILVSYRRLVSFKMGHYEDKIWCVVIHMNIAHYFLASMAF